MYIFIPWILRYLLGTLDLRPRGNLRIPCTFRHLWDTLELKVFNRLFYKHLCHYLSQCSFSSQSSRHHKSQIVRARELNFWENVHPSPCVTCHMSHVMCYMSCVTCHVSHVRCHMSGVTCHVLDFFSYFFFFFFFFYRTKWWSKLVKGLLSMGPTASSFIDNLGIFSTNLRPHYQNSFSKYFFCFQLYTPGCLGIYVFGVTNCIMPKRASVQLLHGQMKLAVTFGYLSPFGNLCQPWTLRYPLPWPIRGLELIMWPQGQWVASKKNCTNGTDICIAAVLAAS